MCADNFFFRPLNVAYYYNGYGESSLRLVAACDYGCQESRAVDINDPSHVEHLKVIRLKYQCLIKDIDELLSNA
jgi:hypothetical protein